MYVCLLLSPLLLVGEPEELDVASLFEKKKNKVLLLALNHTHTINLSRKKVLLVMKIEN